MCGIAGFVGHGTKEELTRATDALQHRGPDDVGYMVHKGVGFGHRRLAVIDLTPSGHQPMFSEDTSVALIFNGEIYNFKERRALLEKAGCVFKSESDTEVLIHSYIKHGTDFLNDMRGMFALALYDFRTRTLILARDRMGEKPLYWTKQSGALWFASELKALFAVGIEKAIDTQSLQKYLQFDYVPTPHTMIQNVFKLEPGTMLIAQGETIEKKIYWAPSSHVRGLSENEALAQLDTSLHESVSQQLVADVPLGVFLSGGLDSSTIAHYAASISSRKVNTFSIGFDDPSFDESSFARAAARQIGTEHHELVMREEDALALVSEIPEVFSEPVADASVIPTMFLSHFARESVTVALGGDGGDELFAGYPTFQADTLFQFYSAIPQPIRSLLRRGAHLLPASNANFSFSYNVQKFVGSDSQNSLERHLGWLGTFDSSARATLLTGKPASDIFVDAKKYAEQFQGEAGNKLLFMYMRTYLMDQVLVKVDRASMRYALETRAPFLDHVLVDFLLSLPYSVKYHRGTTKHLLKQLMKEKLPRDIVFRKKKGFGIPLARWLKGPLRELCTTLLSKSSLERHGLMNHAFVQKLVEEHLQGVRDNRKELWNLMMFQMWYERWMSIA